MADKKKVLSDSKLKEIDWSSYKGIEYLDLTHNEFEKIDINKALPDLKYLAISYNKKPLKVTISVELENLQYLYLYNAQLTECNIRVSLPKLEQLHLGKNNLKKLKLSGGFSNLEELRVDGNANLGTLLLPSSCFSNGKDLSIHYKDTSLDPALLNLLKISNAEEKRAALYTFFQQYETKDIELQEIETAKVVLLGNTDVGKTSLYDVLSGDDISNLQGNSTHGINVFNLDIDGVTVQGYDFGGQDYFHNTHYAFFESVQLYVVIWGKGQPDGLIQIERDAIQEDGFPLNYWLGSIRYFNPEWEVKNTVILQNKPADTGEKKWLDAKTLIQQYPFIKSFHEGVLKAKDPDHENIKAWFHTLIKDKNNHTTYTYVASELSIYKKLASKNTLVAKQTIQKLVKKEQNLVRLSRAEMVKKYKTFFKQAHERFKLFYLTDELFLAEKNRYYQSFCHSYLLSMEDYLITIEQSYRKYDKIEKKETHNKSKAANIDARCDHLLNTITTFEERDYGTVISQKYQAKVQEIDAAIELTEIQEKRKAQLSREEYREIEKFEGIAEDLKQISTLLHALKPIQHYPATPEENEIVGTLKEKTKVVKGFIFPEHEWNTFQKQVEKIDAYKTSLQNYVILKIKDFTEWIYTILSPKMEKSGDGYSPKMKKSGDGYSPEMKKFGDGYFSFKEAEDRLNKKREEEGKTELEDKVIQYALDFMCYHKIIFKLERNPDNKGEPAEPSKIPVIDANARYVAPAYLPREKTRMETLFLKTFDPPLVRFEFNAFFHSSLISEILVYFLEYVLKEDVSKAEWKYIMRKNSVVLYDKNATEEKKKDEDKPMLYIHLERGPYAQGEQDNAHADQAEIKRQDGLHQEDKSEPETPPLVSIEISQHHKFPVKEAFFLRVVNTIEYIIKGYTYEKKYRARNGQYIPEKVIHASSFDDHGRYSPLVAYQNVFYRRADFKMFLPNHRDYPMKKIFISYSKSDVAYLEALKKHLSVLKREGYIDLWTDHELRPGDEWDNTIKENLITSDLVLFLVSNDFLATDYVWNVEIPLAKEYNIECVPIILRSCDWEGTVLGKYNTAPGKAKVIATSDNEDATWKEVVQDLKKILLGLG